MGAHSVIACRQSTSGDKENCIHIRRCVSDRPINQNFRPASRSKRRYWQRSASDPVLVSTWPHWFPSRRRISKTPVDPRCRFSSPRNAPHQFYSTTHTDHWGQSAESSEGDSRRTPCNDRSQHRALVQLEANSSTNPPPPGMPPPPPALIRRFLRFRFSTTLFFHHLPHFLRPEGRTSKVGSEDDAYRGFNSGEPPEEYYAIISGRVEGDSKTVAVFFPKVVKPIGQMLELNVQKGRPIWC